MSDYLCTGGQRPNSDCGGPPPRPFPRPGNDCGGPPPRPYPHPDNDCGGPPPRPFPRPDNDSCGRPDNDGCDRRENRREQRREECACRRGIVQALQMLLRSGLSALVDFQTFAFVTEDYLVGDTLIAATPTAAAYDNLGPELAGSFNRFSPCACDYIDVTGAVFLPTTTDAATGLTASRLNLCDISAIAFGVEADTAEPATDNYQSARRLLQRLLQGPCRPDCPPYPDPCDEMCRCRCDEEDFLGGNVSLIVDGLLLANMAVLGKVGKVLVLANDTDSRFYFVCAERATFVQ